LFTLASRGFRLAHRDKQIPMGSWVIIESNAAGFSSVDRYLTVLRFIANRKFKSI